MVTQKLVYTEVEDVSYLKLLNKRDNFLMVVVPFIIIPVYLLKLPK